MLTGCDVTSQDAVQAALRAVSSFNDRVQALMFRPNHLAPTYSEAEVVKPPRFNAYYGVEDVDRVDGAKWKLELAGRIADKQPWTVAADSTRCPSRNGSSGISASRAGTISGNGPA